MCQLKTLLFILLLIPVLTVAQDTSDEAGQVYNVQAGDNLFTISLQFRSTVSCIRLANELDASITAFSDLESQNIAQIFIPDSCLPADAGQGGGALQSSVSAVSEQSYTVQRGDRLAKIAENFGVTVQCIVQANNIANPDLIYVGQTLVITPDCQASGGGGQIPADNITCRYDRNAGRTTTNGIYTVQAGDALDFIACDFGVDLQCLADANQLENRGRLEIGQSLRIDFSCPAWTDSTLPQGL
jgi:LysM repeat protein